MTKLNPRVTIDERVIEKLVKNKIELTRFLVMAAKHTQAAIIQESEGKAYRGITPGEDLEENEYMLDFKEMYEYNTIKKSSRKSISQIEEMINETMEVFNEYFYDCYYEEHYSYGEAICFKVTEEFKEMFGLAKEIHSNDENYIDFDIYEFNKLSNKYEIYLYLKIKRFASKGLVILSYEKMRELFGDTNKNITRRLKQYSTKIEEITGIKLTFTETKKNRKNITLEIRFKAEKKEVEKPKETPSKEEYDPVYDDFTYEDDAEYIFALYPKKKNKAETINRIKQLLKIHSKDDLVKCVLAYKCEKNEVNDIYIKDSNNFFKEKYKKYLNLPENYKYYLNLIEKQMNSISY